MIGELFRSLTGNTPEARRLHREKKILRDARMHARRDEPSTIRKALNAVNDWYNGANAASYFAKIREQEQQERLAEVRAARKPTIHIDYSSQAQQDLEARELEKQSFVPFDEFVQTNREQPTLDDFVFKEARVAPIHQLPDPTFLTIVNLSLDQEIPEALIDKFSRNASTLAYLSEEDQAAATRTILHDNATSYEQGVGPAAILKRENPELHQKWVAAYHQGKEQPYVVSQKHPTLDDTSKGSVLVPKASHLILGVDKSEKYAKRAAIGTLGIAGALALASMFHQEEPSYTNQPTTQEDVLFSSDFQRPSIEEQLEELTYTPLSERESTLPEYEETTQKTPSRTFEEILSAAPVIDFEDLPSQRTLPDYEDTTTEYVFEEAAPTITTWSGSWNEDYEGKTLPKEQLFNSGDRLYHVFSAVPEDVRRNSVAATAIHNNWYSSDRLENGQLKQGENPYDLDTFPQAGKAYTVILDASSRTPVQETPIAQTQEQSSLEQTISQETHVGSCDSFAWQESFQGQKTTCDYMTEPNDTLLGVFHYRVGIPQELVDSSLIATGLENDLYPGHCVIEQDGQKTFNESCDAREDFLHNKFWAVQEYTIVIDATLPPKLAGFSREDDFGGNYVIEFKN